MGLDILFAGPDEIENIAKALKSPLRRQMLSLLKQNSMNIAELCKALSIPQSTCSLNVQILEKASLISSSLVPASTHGMQKVCTLTHEKVMLSVIDNNTLPETKTKTIETELPIGLFSDFSVSSPCGIISDKGVIGFYDNTSSFLHPSRASAGLLWFTYGFLEYRFPKNFSTSSAVKSLSFSAEICSEYPGHNNIWPSDITLWINNKEVGTWTSPGDMGGTRGLLTPSWWNTNDTQSGFLKTWTITENGTCFEDGSLCSSVKIEDLDVEKYESIIVRIGVKEDAPNRGGINIFGSRFGNYATDLRLKVVLA